MEEQEGIDFLLVEYGKTLDLIQHYDNIRVSLLRFAASYHFFLKRLTVLQFLKRSNRLRLLSGRQVAMRQQTTDLT